jgi:hypothetical protein
MLKPTSKYEESSRLRSELCTAGQIRLSFASSKCCSQNCVQNLIRDFGDDDRTTSSSSSVRREHHQSISSFQYCQGIGISKSNMGICAFDSFVEEVRRPLSELIRGCPSEVEANKQLRYYLVQKFTENRVFVSKNNYSYIYQLHSLSRGAIPVCKTAYIIITGLKASIIDYAQRQVREGISAESILFDKEDDSEHKISSLKDAFDHFALDFSLYEQNLNNFVDVVNIPDTSTGFICATFLAEWFQLAGEQEPNADEIHIDFVSKDEVYEEYKADPFVNSHDKVYEIGAFLKIWREVFPKVKMREYKNVTGKCAVCDACKNMMRQCRNKSVRIIIREYRLMHRAYYMGEKLLYYQRRAEAVNSNGEIGSIIIDKMGTHATSLPILSNLNSLTPPFPVAVTGAISHGSNETTFYLSTPNVDTGASYTIHCILSEMKKLFTANNFKPLKKIYIEADGASDNVAKAVLAACEHLTFKRFCPLIIIARLPVGHTHEDIDSRFGKIWTYIRTRHVYTFDEFCKAIKSAFGYSPLISVQPVFAVYNYKAYYDQFIDPSLIDKYSKLEGTQLYFKIQPLRDEDRACNPANILVRTNYRKFGQDYSLGLRPNQLPNSEESSSSSVAENDLPFQPVVIHASWIPESAKDIECPFPQPCALACPCKEKAAGISFLSTVPEGKPVPLEFSNDYLEKFSKFLDAADTFFRLRREDSSAEYWRLFALHKMPRTNSVHDFTPFYDIDQPLWPYLYGGESFVPEQYTVVVGSSSFPQSRNSTTGFSSESHRLRATTFDLEFLEHIVQNKQTIPWRGHRKSYKNWEFKRACIMQRIYLTRGSGENKRSQKGTCVAWCDADINEGNK